MLMNFKHFISWVSLSVITELFSSLELCWLVCCCLFHLFPCLLRVRINLAHNKQEADGARPGSQREMLIEDRYLFSLLVPTWTRARAFSDGSYKGNIADMLSFSHDVFCEKGNSTLLVDVFVHYMKELAVAVSWMFLLSPAESRRRLPKRSGCWCWEPGSLSWSTSQQPGSARWGWPLNSVTSTRGLAYFFNARLDS